MAKIASSVLDRVRCCQHVTTDFLLGILRLEGRNLRDLYAGLVKHSVSVIHQAETSDGSAEYDTSIEKIEVTDDED